VPATRGALRLGRSAALGASCLLLSLAAHVLAGGPAPPLLAVLVLAVPVACVCVVVTGRQAGLPRIAAVLGMTQIGLHQVFMALAQPGCHGSESLARPMAGHAVAAMPSGCPMPMPAAGESAALHFSPQAGMVAGHVLAAVATALVLWHGERLLWALLAWLGWTNLLIARPGVAPHTRLLGAPAVPRGAGSAAVPGGVGRRGPPVAVPA
jgi:hypothetical protein